MADLLAVGILFAAVALAGVVATAANKSVIPFYIVVGMVLSPSVAGEFTVAGYGLPVVESSEFIDIGAELGIVFLLFFLGLEFNLDRLLASKERIGAVGAIDLVINFGTGLLLGFALFRDPLAAFLVAGIVYISSSAIITKSLIDLGWIANDESDPMLGTLVFEDLFIAVYLTVAAALVTGGSDVTAAAMSVGTALAFIVGLLVLAHYGTPWFERALRTTSNEYTVLRAIGITVLISGVALAIGVSEAVAAFFVGMAFAPTSHTYELENLLEPVRDTFAAVFFFWIGLETDPRLFAGVAGLVVVAAIVTTPTKLISGYLGGRTYDLDPRRSIRVGLGMVTRGEFSLIIAAVAVTGAGTSLSAEMANTIYAFTVAYVLVMSILGTVLMQYSAPFERIAVERFGDST
ncbi:potassium/proton antiporter membrane subunit, CPA2 family [Haloarcula vallismortis]|uniref:Sodium/protn antiporter putative n=2 Tax=Haloarcula vallismortis TaxID=28442 RepID=M0IV80_HALVA|nr:cation:proton antiporter [Haloarcula vallismortis]EMA00626.1 sodium/protn antiporter putative [Haloarcula vallismortis ATCC 29715]SDW01793.1 potassium/proton antiporter membrane subunit, CPA2 family [Haloarcula vallismortis]